MASAIPDEPEDKQENEQAAKAARWSEYLWQIMPKIEIDPADIQVIKSPAGHDVWVHSPRPVDKKKKTAEQKLSRPRNLEELKTIARKVHRDKEKQGLPQKESVRDYVEEQYPKLVTEEQILKKCNNLIRSMNRYKHVLEPTRY
jgi:hypothetical protein